jgi:IS5 family transposase
MKLFNDLCLKFEHPDWSRNPEFGCIDTILEQNSYLYDIVKDDILAGTKESVLGRKDSPSVEQIVRAGLFKEIKGYEYRELEYAQSDSRICSTFIKLDERKPFSFTLFQKYISKITAKNLHKLLVEINKIAIKEGLEDIQKLRIDSTVVESNIHYPTNSSLVFDCIEKSHSTILKLSNKFSGIKVKDYTKQAKKNHFKIVNEKTKGRRKTLFEKQLVQFTKSINQIDKATTKAKKKIL